MKRSCVLALSVLVLGAGALGQEDGPTIKVEVVSSFIWGKDSPSGALSSTTEDPLTGNAIHKLSYGGIDVSSELGFEGLGGDQTGTLLSYTTTIANSTDSTVKARYAGFSIDGRKVSALRLIFHEKKIGKEKLKSASDAMQLDNMQCFASGFLSGEKFFSADPGSQVLSVAPQTAVIVSAVVRDPRDYGSVLCTVEGCHPTGTIRYDLNIDRHDYIFIWSGRSAIYCGR